MYNMPQKDKFVVTIWAIYLKWNVLQQEYALMKQAVKLWLSWSWGCACGFCHQGFSWAVFQRVCVTMVTHRYNSYNWSVPPTFLNNNNKKIKWTNEWPINCMNLLPLKIRKDTTIDGGSYGPIWKEKEKERFIKGKAFPLPGFEPGFI